MVFKCAVQSVFRPNITWLKDGKEFTDSSAKMVLKNTNGTSELRIISVSERDTGNYACFAAVRNFQDSSREAVLSLKGKRVEQLLTIYFLIDVRHAMRGTVKKQLNSIV